MVKKLSSRKKFAARKVAPIGLVLSGLALLSGIIFLAVRLLVLMGIYSPPNQNWINTALLISLGVLVLGLALFALLDPKRVRVLLTGRQARHGSNSLIILLALLGILVVVNLLVYQNQKQWDWTENKEHTLAPETIEALSTLPAKVTAIAFFTSNFSSTSAEELLMDFRDNSNDLFDYQIIDPESNPAMAQQYNIMRDGTIVILLQDRKESLTNISEKDITSALIRLMNPGERVVYFMSGHGESDITNTDDTGLTSAIKILETKNYTVRTLNLRAENQIPSDALAIIIAGPTSPISAGEAYFLKSYLDGGGSILLLEQSVFDQEAGLSSDPFLDYLVDTWGVILNNDLVIDPTSDLPSFAISYSYADHAITTNLIGSNTFFPISRSITLTTISEEITQNALITTVDRAWGETDEQSIIDGVVEFDASIDIPGPILLAAALENSTTKGKMIVVGDSSFATNGYFYYGNVDLFANSVDWLAGEQDMISLTAKETTTRSLNPIKNFGWIILGLSFICIIPGIIVAGGVISWISRRARG
jgi:ABC-type uncharacterized transport system involved in gliding motility auxiliary subunit